MLMSAKVRNEYRRHDVALATAGNSHALGVPSRATGFGSAVNGGELLCLAMATCYCNDIYREAAKRGIEVSVVEVEGSAEFGAEGAPASRLSYKVLVHANAAEAAIRELIAHTDRVAEVQNTLRLGLPVVLEAYTAVSWVRSDSRS